MTTALEKQMKEFGQELTDIKTASKYTSVKTANYTTTSNVTTGLYYITYGGTDDPIMSMVYCGTSGGVWGLAWARTPTTNHQVVEVVADSGAPLVVASNRPITSITRL